MSGVNLALDADKTIEASFDGHDTAGNLVVQTANWAYNADTGGPTPATTTIVLNAVTADNFVTLAEGQTNVTLTGKVTGIYKPGDTVTLLESSPSHPTVNEVFDQWYLEARDPQVLRRLLQAPLAERAAATLRHWLAQVD